MSKYFVKFDHGNMCKNNAEKAVEEYIRALDGILLPSLQTKEDFVKGVKNHVTKLNDMYRRCKDVPVKVWETKSTTNIGFADYICYIRIYKVKEER